MKREDGKELGYWTEGCNQYLLENLIRESEKDIYNVCG